MLNVQNYSLSPVTFKGKSKEKSNKSNAALKNNLTCAVLGSAATVGGAAAGLKINRLLLETAYNEGAPRGIISLLDKNMDMFHQILRRSKWVLPIALLLCTSAGILADKATNKKRAQFDEKVKSLGADEVMASDKHARMSKNGGIYYKTNEGKKWSPLYGVASALTGLLLTCELPKITKGLTAKIALPFVFASLLGGLVEGSITDACANKSARKAADKEALAQKNVNNVAA